MEEGYSSITSDVYDGMLYDAPEHLKSIVNRIENERTTFSENSNELHLQED